VEQPDLGKLDGEVGQEDEERALCLFPGGRNLVLFVVRYLCLEIRAMSHTAWSLYFLNIGSISIMTHGSDRPK
jgi:hypothetical protein